VYLLEKRFDSTAVIKRLVVFENKLRCVADGQFFADITADESFGAVQSGFRIFFDTVITDNGEEYPGKAQVVSNLNTCDGDKTIRGSLRPGKELSRRFHVWFQLLFQNAYA
jgi:hypothetical protein